MLRPEVSLESMILHVARVLEAARGFDGFAGCAAGDAVGAATGSRAMMGGLMRSGRRRCGELLEAAAGVRVKEDSVEFQTRRKWESALDELATLDFDGVRVGFERALEELERIARQTMFAPESREAPVQVMGPLEAAGRRSMRCGFCVRGDLSWPMRRRRAVPCCPGSCSASLGCRGRMARGRRACSADDGADCGVRGTVVFSYREARLRGGRQRPSPALGGLAAGDVRRPGVGRRRG